MTVYVSDGVPGGSPDDSTTATVGVLAEQPNRPPVYAAGFPYGTIGSARSAFFVSLPAGDADADPLTYRVVSGPEGALYSSTGMFEWTAPDSAGVFEFVLEASDGQAAVRRPLFVGVQKDLFGTPAQGPTRAAIRERFSPDQTLGYGPGRDTLYARVEAFPDGIVEGIYTGYRVALAEGVDPSVYLFERGINAEHTWPQSFGAADEPQRSDLHILYPARDEVNTSRGNDPYAEIPDPQTQTWYRRAEQQSGIPADSVDTWSEAASGRFEPRESVKGDVARAALYFAAVYESAADAGFLEEQLETLLMWDQEDPPSAREVVRSGLIQRYQGNVNPFILDPGLAFRAFDGVLITNEPGTEVVALALSAPWPNPSRGAVRMTLTAGAAGPVRVEAFDVLGRRVAVRVGCGGPGERGGGDPVWSHPAVSGEREPVHPRPWPGLPGLRRRADRERARHGGRGPGAVGAVAEPLAGSGADDADGGRGGVGACGGVRRAGAARGRAARRAAGGWAAGAPGAGRGSARAGCVRGAGDRRERGLYAASRRGALTADPLPFQPSLLFQRVCRVKALPHTLDLFSGSFRPPD